MSEKILLTMGMPVYNEEKYIGEAIESLLAQTYKDFILVISDNASTDGTKKICEDYAKKDKRIIYIRHDENKGANFNLKYVIERINTPYFMLCGGHDKWHPLFVEKLLPAVGKDNIVLSFCKFGQINLDGTIGEDLKSNYDPATIDNLAERFLYPLKNTSIVFIHGIWLTQVLKNCNFDLKTFGCDVIILMQASLEGKFEQNKETLFFRRKNREPEGISIKIKRQLFPLYENDRKINVFSIMTSYILDIAKIPFNKRYSFNMATKLWFIINIVYYVNKWYSISILKEIFKKMVGRKIYFKLKHIKIILLENYRKK